MGDEEAGNPPARHADKTQFDSEVAHSNSPEFELNIDSGQIFTSHSNFRLKAYWSIEAEQDLRACYGIEPDIIMSQVEDLLNGTGTRWPKKIVRTQVDDNSFKFNIFKDL